jgi:hypothetical protein
VRINKNWRYVGLPSFDKLMKDGKKRTLKPWNSNKREQGYVNEKGQKDGPWIYIDSSNVKFYYYENNKLAVGSPFLRVDGHWHQGVISSSRGESDKCFTDNPMRELRKCTPQFNWPWKKV